MKIKTIILIITGLIIGLIFLCIVAIGYGGGKGARPVKPNENLISLEKEIKKEVKSDGTDIDTPRNYELDNCDKHGFQQQEVSIYIDNDSLKDKTALKTYVISVNKRLQKIFPYNKKCYDSIIIQTQYSDAKNDSVINNRFSFPMIK